jgi:beta-galactosidase
MNRHAPVFEEYPHIVHGGDYNPDQWRHRPEIIDQDFRLMPKVGVNIVSLGIFAWSALEPEEGRFEFDWMDDIMDRVAAMGGVVALATPTGARPPWLAKRYRETSRITYQGLREPYAGRHNHCYSSPVMREKAQIINGKLAERYADHPALGLWHISNEYGGECFCEHCIAAYHKWLREKYETLDALNEAWWADFWSHRYSDWSEIIPKDGAVEGEKIDWCRFVTDRTIDFMNSEIAAVRAFSDKPVTTNFMGTFPMLNYRRFAPHVSVIANDWYPAYNVQSDLERQAADSAFVHDLMRTMKGGQPWLLMESTPSTTNWQETAKIKRPGQHRLECLQAVAHGADSVMYFQWRKGRGATEKFHGAIVDFSGSEDTRVIRDVKEVGDILPKLDDLVGLPTPAEAAVVFDWESWWALDRSQGIGNRKKQYLNTCQQWYRAFWRRNTAVDVIGDEDDFEGYRVLAAPMLHMLKPGVSKRLRAFVENGGTLVLTYLSGLVDEYARGLMGGWPGDGLRELTGVWVEEQDVIYDTDEQAITVDTAKAPYLKKEYAVKDYCDLMHLEGATPLANFAMDFYAGEAAVTTRDVGAGKVLYVGVRTDDDFVDALIDGLCVEHNVGSVAGVKAPAGVSVRQRTDGRETFVFLLNFTQSPITVELLENAWTDVIKGTAVSCTLDLPPLGSAVLRR